MITIEFLYWSDCPSHPKAWERLQAVLAEEGVDADIERIEVLTDEEAMRHGFHGSPTIRVNGVDVDEAGAGEMPVALACRVYRLEDGRFSPVPSREMIRNAVKAQSSPCSTASGSATWNGRATGG